MISPKSYSMQLFSRVQGYPIQIPPPPPSNPGSPDIPFIFAEHVTISRGLRDRQARLFTVQVQVVYLPPWQETLPFHLLAGCNWSVAPFGAVHHANNRLPAEDGNKSVESALATANKAKRRSFPDTFRC